MSHRTRTWAHFALIFVVVLLNLSVVSAQDQTKPEALGLRPDAPIYALHGQYWVGTMQLQAETISHPTTVTLWYPALNPSGVREIFAYEWGGITILGHATHEAPADQTGGPYPLVVFSHGSNAAPIIAPYLMEHLASQGFVVMAIDHEDNWVSPLPPDDFRSTVTRTQDISWQIDYAGMLTADDGRLAGMIDIERVAVMGHSFGGETALLAGGARLDFGQGSWCDLNPQTLTSPESGSVNLCISGYPGAVEALAEVAGLTSVPEGLWPSWGDPRVDAIVPISPGLQDFSARSFVDLTVPTMLIVGTKDNTVRSDWPLYESFAYDEIGSPVKSFVGFANGDHALVVDKCDTMPWVVEMGASFYCSDPVWDMDRAHDLINHFTTAFLLDVLKGDKEAHAALAPDGVSFAGIVYKAEGF